MPLVMRRRSLRRPSTLLLVFVAAALNVLAPVFAYAIGQPLHELAGGRPGGGARAVLAHHASHDGSAHAAHHHGDATPAHHDAQSHDAQSHDADSAPSTPHCPYCLDFAAGAALGGTPHLDVVAQPGHAPLAEATPSRISARSSLRIAAPRGPPLAG